MKQELYDFYKAYQQKVNAYRLALTTMHFDQATIAPKDGADYANTMISILAGECFSYECDPENIKKIEALYAICDDDILKKELQLRLKDLDEVRTLPKELYVAYRKCCADSECAWEDAKQKQDYSLFKPHLEAVYKMINQVLTYSKRPGSAYDKLLDQFQEGMTQEKYDLFFERIKEKLLPFIKRIQEEGKAIDDSLLFQEFDLEKQAQFAEKIQDYLQVNRKECYMGTTEHPFTSDFSLHDVRITTHYYKHNVMSAILSTVHEYGHALFGLQVNPEWEGTTLASNIGMALHESQSRFLENHIGRSDAFWEVNYPTMQQHFPQLANVSLKQFIEMINVTRCSLVRTEADELTYPIHILIRYELEKELFEGKIDFDHFNEIWADRYEKYLGVRPQNDAEGILQDVHWSDASFGYFPTYAYGSAIAAQLFHQLEKEIDVEDTLRSKDFKTISEWLRTHVHQYGALKTIDEILLETTKETFNPDYYIDYLINKFSKIYELK